MVHQIKHPYKKIEIIHTKSLNENYGVKIEMTEYQIIVLYTRN